MIANEINPKKKKREKKKEERRKNGRNTNNKKKTNLSNRKAVYKWMIFVAEQWDCIFSSSLSFLGDSNILRGSKLAPRLCTPLASDAKEFPEMCVGDGNLNAFWK